MRHRGRPPGGDRARGRRPHLLRRGRQGGRDGRRRGARARRLPRRDPRADGARHRPRRRRARERRRCSPRSSCRTCPRRSAARPTCERRCTAQRAVMLNWLWIAGFCALATVVGYGVADIDSDEFQAGINGFAAGALIVMLVDSMIPEATEQAGQDDRPRDHARIRRRGGLSFSDLAAPAARTSSRARRRSPSSRAITTISGVLQVPSDPVDVDLVEVGHREARCRSRRARPRRPGALSTARNLPQARGRGQRASRRR